MTSSSLRVVVAAVVLAGVALYATAAFLIDQQRMLEAGQGPPPPALFEARFAPLRTCLPKDGGVGYVTDLPPTQTRGYYMARYVLSPTRVAWQTPCEIAVGDFYDPRAVAGVLRREGYAVVRDLGGGVMLLERRARP